MCLFSAYNWTSGPVVLFDQTANSRAKLHQTVFPFKSEIIQNRTNKFQYFFFYYEYSTECDYTAWM